MAPRILVRICQYILSGFFFLWSCDPTLVMASSFLRFLDHTQRRTTFGRTPLDEWSAHRRDPYLITHNNKQETSIYAPSGIRAHNISRRAAADLRVRPRNHWNRPRCNITRIKTNGKGMWRDSSPCLKVARMNFTQHDDSLMTLLHVN